MNKALLVLFLITMAGCKKQVIEQSPVDDLPAPTQTGANIIAWRTDGVPYISSGFVNSVNVEVDTNKSSRYFNTGNFSIQTTVVNNKGFKRGVILVSPMNISFPIQPGTIFPISYGGSNALFESVGDSTAINVFGGRNGSITVTYYNFDNKIISGSFSFDALKNATGLIRKISDGQFDAKFYFVH